MIHNGHFFLSFCLHFGVLSLASSFSQLSFSPLLFLCISVRLTDSYYSLNSQANCEEWCDSLAVLPRQVAKITSLESFKKSIDVSCLGWICVWFPLEVSEARGTTTQAVGATHVTFLTSSCFPHVDSNLGKTKGHSVFFILIMFTSLLFPHKAYPSCFAGFFWSGVDIMIMKKEYSVLWNRGLPKVSVIISAADTCWVSPVDRLSGAGVGTKDAKKAKACLFPEDAHCLVEARPTT